MNSVPVAFVDSLVAHLSKCALRDLFLTSGNFASRAAHHYRQRRYLDVYLKLEGSDVGVEVKYGHDEVPFQLDPLFDRIVRIESTDSRNVASKTVPMDRFENSVLPALRSVMDRCRLLLYGDFTQQRLYDAIFEHFKEASCFRELLTANFGEKCQEFIVHQVKSNSLQELRLSPMGERPWPAHFQAVIKEFVKSASFKKLYIRGTRLNLDLDMVTSVFDRFFEGSQCEGMGLYGELSFPLTAFNNLYQQFAPYPWPKNYIYGLWLSENRRKLEVTRGIGNEVNIYTVP
ncbi:hypothetical protein QR680_007025 [Steinernema hermaphroditum]|uniref:Uncharacterized protein n=1 Tax=Steinernema hermaphroditum TaxID=289476 RepID=A0AA39HYI4_9BILA|nr:hypothetical protein QR680_007025 [Steinernema hermaphroditum]